MHYFASLLVRYKNAVVSHSLEFAVQNAMRYRLSATLLWRLLAMSEHGSELATLEAAG